MRFRIFLLLTLALAPATGWPADGEDPFYGGSSSRFHWFCKYVFEGLGNLKFYLTDPGYTTAGKLWKVEQKDTKGFKHVRVRLGDLYPIHHLNTPGARRRTMWRAVDLSRHKDEILQAGEFTFEMQRKITPSDVVMTVIQDRHGNFILREGNGRWWALKEVFPNNPDLIVEVRLRDLGRSEEAWKILDESLAHNGLTVGPRDKPPWIEVVRELPMPESDPKK